MGQVNVLVTASLEPAYLQQLEGIDPSIKVTYAADDFLRLGKLTRQKGAADDEVKRLQQSLDVALRDAEVLLCYRLPKTGVTGMPNLKWIQFWSAGVDHHLSPELVATDIRLTSMSGVHAIPISEHIMTFMLMFSRNVPFFVRQQEAKKWGRFDLPELYEKTVSIIGLGNIGKQTAALAKAFGMRIISTSRSATAGTTAENIDRLFSKDQLLDMLAESDFVVLTLPYTKETEKLIGERELKAMKKSAYLINISRGPIVDEAALSQALKDNVIAGAGLDVFETEPLPVESELWSLPNVIVTPHVSGGSVRYMERATNLFAENLRRYIKEERLVNLVDRERGY